MSAMRSVPGGFSSGYSRSRMPERIGADGLAVDDRPLRGDQLRQRERTRVASRRRVLDLALPVRGRPARVAAERAVEAARLDRVVVVAEHFLLAVGGIRARPGEALDDDLGAGRQMRRDERTDAGEGQQQDDRRLHEHVLPERGARARSGGTAPRCRRQRSRGAGVAAEGDRETADHGQHRRAPAERAPVGVLPKRDPLLDRLAVPQRPEQRDHAERAHRAQRQSEAVLHSLRALLRAAARPHLPERVRDHQQTQGAPEDRLLQLDRERAAQPEELIGVEQPRDHEGQRR